jgi:predicted extracellular nuclease
MRSFNLLMATAFLGFSSGMFAQCGLFISEYSEGSSNNKYIEIYNPTNDAVDLTQYAIASVGNAPTTVGVHEYWNAFAEGATIAPGDVYVWAKWRK